MTTNAAKTPDPLACPDLYILAINYDAKHIRTPDKQWASGDFTGDGWVDVKDLTLLAMNWQAGVNGGGITWEEAKAQYPWL